MRRQPDLKDDDPWCQDWFDIDRPPAIWELTKTCRKAALLHRELEMRLRVKAFRAGERHIRLTCRASMAGSLAAFPCMFADTALNACDTADPSALGKLELKTAEYMEMSKSDLQELCRDGELPPRGTVTQLANRVAFLEFFSSDSREYEAQMGLRLEVKLPCGASSELKWFKATVEKQVRDKGEWSWASGLWENGFNLRFDAQPDLPFAGAEALREVTIDGSE